MRSLLARLRNVIYFGFHRELEFPRWALLTRFGRRSPVEKNNLMKDVLLSSYSAQAFSKYNPLKRTEWLFHAVGAIPGDPRGKCLIVGPRFPNERYLAMGLGFVKESIYLVDSYSYCKDVTQGDMHQLHFPEQTFDFVICGWTLAYSANPKRALDEFFRVMKEDAWLVIGMDIQNASRQIISDREELLAYMPDFVSISWLENAGNVVATFTKRQRYR